MRKINSIIVHCSATKRGHDIGAKQIRELHVKGNGWKDIGYHYVIRINGVIEKGRPLDVVGAHCQGHNADSIGICLVGGLNAKGKPENTFTQAQFDSLKKLIVELKEQFGNLLIFGHNEFSNKACPCFDVKEFVQKWQL